MPTYDPTQVVVTVDGMIISGYAAGTFVAVERSADTFTKVVGTDGLATRVKSGDKSGSLTITLMQSSNSNDVLDTLAAKDELDNSGVVPVQVQDLSGRTVIFASEGWIRKKPNAEFADSLSNREWILDLAKVEVTHGGN